MTPKNPAQDLREYIDDRLANCAEWEEDGGGDDSPHFDRATLENLSLAVELLDALVACWYAEDIDGHAMIAETAARRVFGWVPCTACNLLFPADALTGGMCTECADAAADDTDPSACADCGAPLDEYACPTCTAKVGEPFCLDCCGCDDATAECTVCRGRAGVCGYCGGGDCEPCYLGHLDCSPWPEGPCANERREGRCFTCAEIAPPLNAEGDCARCSAPAAEHPFGGALDR